MYTEQSWHGLGGSIVVLQVEHSVTMRDSVVVVVGHGMNVVTVV